MPDDASFLPTAKLLTDNEILNLVDIFVNKFGIKKIRYTGGEPLVRHSAFDLIESISNYPVEQAITTNGVLLHNYLKLFSEVGLKSINVSLDSMIPEVFYNITRRRNLEVVQRNISNAIAEGFNIKINMVVMRGINLNEVSDFVKWTLDTYSSPFY